MTHPCPCRRTGRTRSYGLVAAGLAAPASELYTSGALAPRIREMSGNFLIDLVVFISYVLTLYVYILIAAAVMSWLIAFNVVNPRNQFVAMVAEFLYRITEPVLRPIRERAAQSRRHRHLADHRHPDHHLHPERHLPATSCMRMSLT